MTFYAHQGIDIVVEAGSLLQTIQLVYSPVDIGKVPTNGKYRHRLKTFDLLAYDYGGEKVSPFLVRPWVLTIRLKDLELSQVDMSRLMIGRFDVDSEEWVPIITSYYPSDELLVSTILEVGRFAIMSENWMPLPGS